MKVVQNGSTNTDTLSTCLSDVSNTADMEPSPLDHLSGNLPVLMSHPRMNSRSEQRAFHCIPTPLDQLPACHSSVFAYVCIIFTVSSPLLLSGRPRDYCRRRCCVRLRRRRPYPYCRASRQAVPLPLSQISPICLYLSLHQALLLLRYIPIQLHSLSLSPLDVPSFILCCLV